MTVVGQCRSIDLNFLATSYARVYRKRLWTIFPAIPGHRDPISIIFFAKKEWEQTLNATMERQNSRGFVDDHLFFKIRGDFTS